MDLFRGNLVMKLVGLSNDRVWHNLALDTLEVKFILASGLHKIKDSFSQIIIIN